MRMYKVLILPLAEEDIMNNTDYIAFEKKAPERHLMPFILVRLQERQEWLIVCS